MMHLHSVWKAWWSSKQQAISSALVWSSRRASKLSKQCVKHGRPELHTISTVAWSPRCASMQCLNGLNSVQSMVVPMAFQLLRGYPDQYNYVISVGNVQSVVVPMCFLNVVPVSIKQPVHMAIPSSVANKEAKPKLLEWKAPRFADQYWICSLQIWLFSLRKKYTNDGIVYFIIYVDDLLLTWGNIRLTQEIKQTL